MGGKPYKIIWSSAAYKDYERVLDYLFCHFGITVTLSFIDKIEHKQHLLSYEPLLGRASEKDPTIRSLLITVHNRLYYTIDGNSIHILRMFDTRQDPEKNLFE